jgi:hypothetical protein
MGLINPIVNLKELDKTWKIVEKIAGLSSFKHN